MPNLPPALAKRLEPFGELDQSQTITPALTIDEFFVGNTDEGSIGCNLVPHPGIKAFEEKFRALAAHKTVPDIRFPVTEFIDGLDWPFVDNVIIVTSAEAEQIFNACSELQPNDFWVVEGEDLARFEGVKVPTGFKAVNLWWD